MPILPEANLELRQDKKWVFNEQKVIDIERRIIDNQDSLKFENHEGMSFFSWSGQFNSEPLNGCNSVLQAIFLSQLTYFKPASAVKLGKKYKKKMFRV